jgi:carboxynorspermidine decarboxylase
MVGDGNTDRIVRAVSAKDSIAATEYHTLSDGQRREVLNALGEKGSASLTRFLKTEKKKVFFQENKKVLAISAHYAGTPVYLLDERLIRENMQMLRYVKDRTGCKILHALKSFASFALFPLMRRYLDGTCASGIHEARLGREEFKKEVHTFSAGYKKEEAMQIAAYSDTVIFNSFHQIEQYGKIARDAGAQVGLRVNPGYSEVAVAAYDPCAPHSRLGITVSAFVEGITRCKIPIDGLHFHAMCEQNSDVLERILRSFERLYGPYIQGLKWVNFGGGHHVTRDDYDVERLVRLINSFKNRYGVEVYLEPGEASVYNAGFLIASILDIIENGMKIAVLDASAEAHMPDVLLMPYRPNVLNSGQPSEKKCNYRFAGPSCLAGDVMGDYSFHKPLQRGDKIIFADMALYSIVKNTTFNGIGLPAIAILKESGQMEVTRIFGYDDYRTRQS